jgi:hypothetical protein
MLRPAMLRSAHLAMLHPAHLAVLHAGLVVRPVAVAHRARLRKCRCGDAQAQGGGDAGCCFM